MADKHRYDKNGKYLGKISDKGPNGGFFGVILTIIAIIVVSVRENINVI